MTDQFFYRVQEIGNREEHGIHRYRVPNPDQSYCLLAASSKDELIGKLSRALNIVINSD